MNKKYKKKAQEILESLLGECPWYFSEFASEYSLEFRVFLEKKLKEAPEVGIACQTMIEDVIRSWKDIFSFTSDIHPPPAIEDLWQQWEYQSLSKLSMKIHYLHDTVTDLSNKSLLSLCPICLGQLTVKVEGREMFLECDKIHSSGESSRWLIGHANPEHKQT